MKLNQQKVTALILILFFSAILFLPVLTLAEETKEVQHLRSTLEATAPAGLQSGDLQTRLGTVINFGFGLLGAGALVVVLLGGVLWMMAGGNEEKLQRAVKIVFGGVEGMIIIFFAYAMLYVVLAALGGATG